MIPDDNGHAAPPPGAAVVHRLPGHPRPLKRAPARRRSHGLPPTEGRAHSPAAGRCGGLPEEEDPVGKAVTPRGRTRVRARRALGSGRSFAMPRAMSPIATVGKANPASLRPAALPGADLCLGPLRRRPAWGNRGHDEAASWASRHPITEEAQPNQLGAPASAAAAARVEHPRAPSTGRMEQYGAQLAQRREPRLFCRQTASKRSLRRSRRRSTCACRTTRVN